MSEASPMAAYRVPELPLEPLPAGRCLLVVGGPMTAAERVVHRATASESGEGTVFVATNRTGDDVLDRRRELGIRDGDRLRIIDCVSRQQGTDPSDERVTCVPTPGDLTGTGMRVSAGFESLGRGGVDRVRVGLHTLSTVLMYADERPAWRFVHTVVGRVAAADGVGLFGIDPDSHDDRVLNTFQQLCDGRIDVRGNGEDAELRVRGLTGQPDGWLALD